MTVATKSKAAEVGALSRVNFVGLLQKEAASQQKRIANKTASAPLSEPATKTQEDSSEDDGDIDEEEDGDNAGVKRKRGWGALQEGLLVDKKLALKVSVPTVFQLFYPSSCGVCHCCGVFHRIGTKMRMM